MLDTQCAQDDRKGGLLLRYSNLEARGIVRNREQLRQLIGREGFPGGWKLSANTRVWDEADVETWLQRRRAQATISN